MRTNTSLLPGRFHNRSTGSYTGYSMDTLQPMNVSGVARILVWWGHYIPGWVGGWGGGGGGGVEGGGGGGGVRGGVSGGGEAFVY